MAKKNERRSDCPICLSLDIFGDKWSLLVIRDMMVYDKNTYGEFMQMKEGIATNILADRLAILEQAKIISKEHHPDSKAKYFYKLTAKGIDLIPVALELIIWGGKYYDITPQMREVINVASQNKAKFMKDLANKLKKV